MLGTQRGEWRPRMMTPDPADQLPLPLAELPHPAFLRRE